MRALRTETVGGLVLLAAAAVALVWVNSPWSGAYEEIRDFHFGIPARGLDLSVGHWTADGLLAVFFLVAGSSSSVNWSSASCAPPRPRRCR